MVITNLDGVQRFGKCVSIELGIVTRSRHRPHIEDANNLVAPQQIDKRVYWPI